jgi:ferrous iron transport protein B
MVFVPQIFILFFLLGLLEDSGYLARASVLMDRFFSYFGLSGKAFVPLLSSFACAVPAIMATRSISDKKQKLLTMVAIPFMTCSAKLPVYALLISVLLGSEPTWKKSLLLTTIYFLSFLIGAVASKIVFYFLRKNKIDTNFLVLELPAYHKPNIMFNIKSALRRTKSYLTKAGPVILIISVLIWMTTALPLKDKQVANINDSYLGQFGQKIESVFQPMGANWKVGLSLLTSFAAREVFVSTLAIIYAPSMKDSDETKIIKTLSEMKDGNGTPIITWPLALSILTFFMFALQCLTTTVMMYKESMSLTFALSQLLTMNLVAYFLAVIVYQSFS